MDVNYVDSLQFHPDLSPQAKSEEAFIYTFEKPHIDLNSVCNSVCKIASLQQTLSSKNASFIRGHHLTVKPETK